MKEEKNISRYNEKMYELIAENSNDLIRVIDKKFKIEYINESTHLRLLGYSKKDLIGRNAKKIIHPDEIENVNKYLRETLKNGEAKREGRIKHKDGYWIWFDIRSKLFKGHTGEWKGLIVSRDITERKTIERRLKESEEKYRNILNNIREGYYEVDLKGNFTFCNDRMYEFLGYRKNELLGVNFRNIVVEENQEFIYKKFNSVYKSEYPQDIVEFKIIGKDGKRSFVESSVSLKLNSKGEKIGFFGLARNITKKKETEQKLKESEEKFRLAFENAADAIFWADPKTGLIINCNKAAEILLEKRKEEIIGQHQTIVHPLQKAEYYAEMFQRHIQQKGVVNDEATVITKSGKIISVHITATVTLVSGVPIIQGIFRDITERKQAEQKLKESEKKFREIIETIIESYYEVDLNGNFTFITDAVCEISGYPSEEIIGANYRCFVSENGGKKMFKIFNNVYKTGIPNKNFQYEFIRRDGKITYGESSIYLKYDSNGNKVGFSGIMRDITEKRESEQKLKESEEKFRTIADQSLLGIAIMQDNRIKYLNKKWADIFEYTIEELKSWKPGEFIKNVHPEDKHLVLEQVRKKQLGLPGVLNQYQFRAIKKSGDIIWLDNFGKTINYKGRPANLSIITDITKEKEAKRKLKESEEKYRDLFEKSPYSIVLTTPEGIVLDCNRATEDIFGFQKYEIIGKNYLNLNIYTPRQVKKFIKRFLAFKRGQIVPSLELQIRKKDGSFIWINYQSSLINLDNQLLIQTIIQDISNKKLIEQELKKSEEKYRLITENANDMIAIYNQRLKFEYINEPIHKEIMGYSKEDLIGKSAIQFIHPDDIKVAARALREAFIKKGKAIADIRAKTKYNTYKWLEMRGNTFIDYEGKKKISIIFRDITDKKKAEQQLKKSEKKYRNAYDLANFYKDLFAHDMSNILQSIISNIELCGIFVNKQEQLKKLEDLPKILKVQAKRGASLISNVRKLSKLEEKEIITQPTDVNKYLKEAVDFTYKSFPERNINIEIHRSLEKLYLQADNFLIDVFENLLNNAVIHNDSEKIKIEIKISECEKDKIHYLKLEFIDNGRGIANERKKIIFDRSYTKDISKRRMGIGLSLVKKIIDNYGGKIWIEDRVKGDWTKGSIFVVLFLRV